MVRKLVELGSALPDFGDRVSGTRAGREIMAVRNQKEGKASSPGLTLPSLPVFTFVDVEDDNRHIQKSVQLQDRASIRPVRKKKMSAKTLRSSTFPPTKLAFSTSLPSPISFPSSAACPSSPIPLPVSSGPRRSLNTTSLSNPLACLPVPPSESFSSFDGRSSTRSHLQRPGDRHQDVRDSLSVSHIPAASLYRSELQR